MTAKLIVTAGTSRGAQFPLTDRIIFNIGSDRGSTVFLDDAKVSPNHCRLYKEDSKFTLFDVSGKGLSVNGKKVVKAVLAEGDVVQIGDTEIRFTTADAPPFGGGASAPVAAAAAAAPMPQPPPASAGAANLAAPAARSEGNPQVGANYPAPGGFGGAAAAPAFSSPAGGGSAEPRGYSRVWLQCVEGNDKGKTFDLSEGNVWVIGRGHSADITVMDIKVSRAHCRIDRQGNTFYLNDLNSTNGSFLNGQQVDRQVLHKGDYVKVGYTILSFQYEEVAEVAAAPPAYAPPPPPVFAPPPPPPPVRQQQHQQQQPQQQQHHDAAAAAGWGAPPPAPSWGPAPAPAAPPPAWGPAPAAAPSWGGARDHGKHEGADAESDYRAGGVLNYDEVDSHNDDHKRLAQASAHRSEPPSIMGGGQPPEPPGRKWAPPPPPPPTRAPAPPLPPPDEDVPLDMAALDDDAEFGGGPPGRAPSAPPPAWGPGAAPQAPSWGAPPPPAAQRPPPLPAWNDPNSAPAAPPPGWGQVPPPPQRPPKSKTSDMMVPDLDAGGDDLFGDGPGGPPPAPGQAWGAPPAPAPGAWAPSAPPPGWGQQPGAPAVQDRPRHKTGELPVSDYLVRGGPAPPPISSEQNAPIACFLCRRPFTQDDMRQNRLRRIKDNYYCLHCVEQA